MKKIGILTYIKEYSNLGTNMQGYCTLKAIQKAYPDAHVELINYSGWKHGRRPYLSDISPLSLKNDFVRFAKYDAFFKKELTFGARKFVSADRDKSIKFIQEQNYDAIFVGSDTVLEFQRAGQDTLTAYWLSGMVDCRKFLIAASSHNAVHENLSENQKDLIQKTIDDFSLLGVRDDPTFRLLSAFVQPGDARLRVIPDPTFIYEIDYSFVENYLRRKKLTFNKPVVCLHLLRDTKWAWDLSKYFRQAGFIVASLRPAHYADIIFTDLSPFEQMGIYRYFSLVITHRFHDAVFCLKNLTPVVFSPEHVGDVTLHHESKTLTLFKQFGLERTNYIENKDDLTAQYLFESHQEAIRSVRRNEGFIRTVLKEQKDRYEAFVKDSRKICMGQ